MDAYMDNDVGDDITILAHLLTAQYQRWAIFSLFLAHFQSVFSPFAIYFQPIYIQFLNYLLSGFSPFFNLFFQPIIIAPIINKFITILLSSNICIVIS